MTNDLDLVLDYARRHLGVHYLWGGNNRLKGMDCSGFICEVLRAFGLVKEQEDLSAQMLYDVFKAGLKTSAAKPRDLIFFGENTSRIMHVSMALSRTRMIESGGGDKRTDSFATAAHQGALVRERPIHFRTNIVGVIELPWPSEI